MGLRTCAFLAALIFTLPAWALAGAADIDWAKVGSQKLTLFYPGVTSWEFLTSDDHRLGGREIKKAGKDCRHCHLSKEGELDLKADEIASGSIKMKRSHNPFEPEPIAGKKGVMTASLQAAYDDEFAYLRVEWASKGTGWSKKASNGAPDRVSVQINKAEPYFKKYGCFITCHNDLNTMPASPSKKEVAAHPYYGGHDRTDVRLYAFYARNSWSDKKGGPELEKKLKEGGSIDLWSADIEQGAVTSRDGWIFDDRVWEENGDVQASGGFANGKNVIVFKRKLKVKDPHDVSLSEGEAALFSIAVHEDGAVKRKHYVSFPFSIGFGADGEIKAERLKH